MFPDHLHDNNIKLKKADDIIYSPSEGISHSLDYHICEKEHECKDLCKAPGVCQIGYDVEERIWKSDISPDGFPYQYFIPKNKREACKVMIQLYKNTHEGEHHCKIASHRCEE